MKWMFCLSLVLGSAAVAAPAQVNFTAVRGGYTGPAAVGAGLVNVTLHNATAMPLGAQLFKLRPGVTVSRVLGAVEDDLIRHPSDGDARLATLVEGYGGPADTPRGTTSAAQVVLTPGRYLLVAMGGDESTRRTYSSMGYHKLLTVTGTAAGAHLPGADYTASMVDYRFEMPGKVKAGRHTWRVVNRGAEPHFMVLAKLLPGKTMGDVMAAMQNPKGPPPVDFQHSLGTQAFTTGRANNVTWTLTPGHYVVACFITSPKTGKDHASMGMVKELVVER